MSEPTVLHPHTHAHDHSHAHPHGGAHAYEVSATQVHRAKPATKRQPARTVLAWPAWLRVLAVMPVIAALWLAVWWAQEGSSLW